jgi:small conductance mechanosensitive channel
MKGTPQISSLLLLVGFVIAAASLMHSSARADDEGVKGGVIQETAEDEAERAMTKSERAVRLKRMIEEDRQTLAEIKQRLAGREELFGKLTGRIQAGEQELLEKRSRLEKMGGSAASEEAARLAAEIQSIEEIIEVGRKQSEITFQSAKTLQGEVEVLKRKIANGEQVFERLVGRTAEDPSAGEGQVPGRRPPGTGKAPGSTAAQPPVPGAGAGSSGGGDRPGGDQPDSAEQIEARLEADKAEAEAREAAEAVADFVEQKQALEEQVAMERELVQAARESRDNLQRGLRIAQDELNRLIAEDAGTIELQKARRIVETSQDLLGEAQAAIDQHRDSLESLYADIEALQRAQLAITQEAEAKRLEAERARRKTVWLESPLHPGNLWHWISNRGPRMVLVIAVAWGLLALIRMSARRIARAVVGRRAREGAREGVRGANRADTLALSFRSALSLFIIVAAVLLVFQEAGVDIKTVLGGAAIVGVALAFGAQNLMRDYFTGFMILLEDQFELGDLITVGGITGTVEKENMRTTMLSDIEGRMHFIPNGEIKELTNRTYVWGRAVLDVPVDYEEDVDRAMAVILEAAEEFRDDAEMGDWVTDKPVMLGVDKFTNQGVVIKFMVQTRPDKIFPARRELMRRVKKKFDAEGIRMGGGHWGLIRTLLAKSEA